MKQLVIAGLVTGAAIAAQSALAEGNVYVTPMVGAVMTDHSDIEVGIGGYGILGVNIDDRWAIETNINYSDVEIGSSESYRRSALALSVRRNWNFQYFEDLAPKYNPFLTAGIGGTKTEFLDTKDYAPSADFSVGVIRQLDDKDFDLRASLNYRFDIHRGTAAFNDDIYYTWALMFGVQFDTHDKLRFGHDGQQASTAEAAPYSDDSAPAERGTLPAVTFPLDSAQLTDEARATLDAIISIMNEQPNTSVIVRGHADDTGPSEYNLALSESRASEAMDYLVDHGIDPLRLSVDATGENSPVASNATADGRRANRRVEFVIQ
jgi:outer membrane protein OmpA-like peptidoglycan-associated protein